MSERERVREMRKRKLKRAVIIGMIVLFFIRRHNRRGGKRDAETE